MNQLVSTLRSASRQWRALSILTIAAALPAQTGPHGRGPVLPPGCEAIAAPAGNVVSLHVFARGVQIYQWDDATGKWVFVAPAALLYADAECHGVLGAHFAGPTWVTTSGSNVVGSVVASCMVDAGAVPWLLLRAVIAQGAGPLARTTFVQRVDTIGGRAPARAGSANEIVWVPYSAEYYFYRAH